jgi:hypothetical protein
VANGTFTAYSLPAVDRNFTGSRPMAISAATDGTLWLAQYGGYSRPAANAIVRIEPDPDRPSAAVYPLGAGRFPLAVTADTRGNVWFAVSTDVAPAKIGRLAGVVAGGTPGPGPGPGDGGGGGTVGGGGGGGTTPPPAGGGNPPSRPLVVVSIGVARAGTPSTDGDSMRIDQICVGPPEARCSLVYIISAGEYVTGFPNTSTDDRDRNRAVTAVASAQRQKSESRDPRPEARHPARRSESAGQSDAQRRRQKTAEKNRPPETVLHRDRARRRRQSAAGQGAERDVQTAGEQKSAAALITGKHSGTKVVPEW